MAWVDNLRATIAFRVVLFHCCITYSHVGDWYIKDGPEGTLTDKLPYIFLYSICNHFSWGYCSLLQELWSRGRLTDLVRKNSLLSD